MDRLPTPQSWTDTVKVADERFFFAVAWHVISPSNLIWNASVSRDVTCAEMIGFCEGVVPAAVDDLATRLRSEIAMRIPGLIAGRDKPPALTVPCMDTLPKNPKNGSGSQTSGV